MFHVNNSRELLHNLSWLVPRATLRTSRTVLRKCTVAVVAELSNETIGMRGFSCRELWAVVDTELRRRRLESSIVT